MPIIYTRHISEVNGIFEYLNQNKILWKCCKRTDKIDPNHNTQIVYIYVKVNVKQLCT